MKRLALSEYGLLDQVAGAVTLKFYHSLSSGSSVALSAMTSLDFEGRLIIVSNRLPVSIERMGDGQYDLSPSSGGLVAGLRGLVNGGVEFLWYGWPGIEVPQEDISHIREELLHKHNAVPVLLD